MKLPNWPKNQPKSLILFHKNSLPRDICTILGFLSVYYKQSIFMIINLK